MINVQYQCRPIAVVINLLLTSRQVRLYFSAGHTRFGVHLLVATAVELLYYNVITNAKSCIRPPSRYDLHVYHLMTL